MPAATARYSGSRATPKSALPQLASFECNGCGAVHQSPDTDVPVGWTTRQGSAWCTDCTTLGVPLRTLRRDGRRAA